MMTNRTNEHTNEQTTDTPVWRNSDIWAFARHYDIPLADAKLCWERGGNWARAFDELVRMYRAEVRNA